MKKMIFTLLLAIVSSAWMMSEAACFASYYSLDEIWGMKTGMVQRVAYPCAEGQDCPTCMTLALVTEANQVWYLTPYNAQIQSQLEALESHINEWYTVEGQPFWHDGYHFMNVREISLASARIPSLCDEWHVLHEPFECMGPYCYLETDIYRLMSDTVISPIDSNTPFQFVKLAENGQYKGALREGTNRDIYYVPAGSQNAYLLYAFNAQVGDTLSNLWVGGFGRDYQGVVQAISNGSPRIFTIGVKFGDESDDYLYPIRWIEGVGSPETPMGMAVVPDVPADIGVYTLLCAYKNGEQVYSSPKAQKYGCEFNGIPSTKPYHLCDEWNVLEISNVTCGYCEEYRTYNFHLTTDTVIGGLLYSQLIKDGAYKGALREGNNRDIYCVPAGCSQEYLLYAFNAQVGDSLKNIWVGGHSSWIPDVRSAIVSEIKQTTPRTIELEVHYYEAPDAYEESIRNLTWIEGIGMPFGPMGAECSIFNGCADSRAKLLLCAYKNGEQVYVSEMGEQYGCEYNYNPNETPTDTIPLFSYTGDDPGSSTVDPVDPNQVVATLQGDQLTIHENSGEDITYSLQNTSSQQAPAQYRAPQSATFRNEVTVQLSEYGFYTLTLTNPSWDYSIVGSFRYMPEDIGNIRQGEDRGRLILHNGQLFILRGDNIYTLQGQKIK